VVKWLLKWSVCVCVLVVIFCLSVLKAFILNVAQNVKKYFRPVTTYKMGFAKQSDTHPDVLACRKAEINATGVPMNIILGHGWLRRKDEDLITW